MTLNMWYYSSWLSWCGCIQQYAVLSFRRMFPHCKVNIFGLVPYAKYILLVDMVPEDGFRYKVRANLNTVFFPQCNSDNWVSLVRHLMWLCLIESLRASLAVGVFQYSQTADCSHLDTTTITLSLSTMPHQRPLSLPVFLAPAGPTL